MVDPFEHGKPVPALFRQYSEFSAKAFRYRNRRVGSGKTMIAALGMNPKDSEPLPCRYEGRSSRSWNDSKTPTVRCLRPFVGALAAASSCESARLQRTTAVCTLIRGETRNLGFARAGATDRKSVV